MAFSFPLASFSTFDVSDLEFAILSFILYSDVHADQGRDAGKFNSNVRNVPTFLGACRKMRMDESFNLRVLSHSIRLLIYSIKNIWRHRLVAPDVIIHEVQVPIC